MEGNIAHLEACRICADYFLSAEMEFMSLFDTKQNEVLDFIQNELKAWQLKISPNDGLPQRICSNCFKRFCSIRTFRLECERAQEKFGHARIQQCSNSGAEDMVQLQLLPDMLSILPGSEFLKSEAALEVAEVVVGVDSTQEPQLPAVDFSVYGHDFSELPTSALMNTIVADDLMHESATSDVLTLIPTIPTANLEFSSPSDILFDRGENCTFASKTVETEMNGMVPQDLEEMLQGSIIPTIPYKHEMKNETNTSSTKPMESFEEENANYYTYKMEDDSLETYEDLETDVPPTRLSGNPLACQYCYCPPTGNIDHLVFQNCELLSRHFFDVHDPNSPYTCCQCHEVFKTARHRDEHVQQQHTQVVSFDDEQCPYCHQKIRVSLEMHENNCGFVGDWECSYCGEKFSNTTLQKFKAHERLHNNRQFRCSMCPRTFSRRSALEMHEMIHVQHANKLINCDICQATFVSEYEMKRHKYSVHNGDLPTKCEFCNKGFVSMAFLKRHLEHFHLQKNPEGNASDSLTCANCATVFSSKHKLRNHLQRPRDENGKCTNTMEQQKQKRREQRQGLFPCAHCSRRFHLKTQLEKHLHTHDERLRPHQCDQCHVRCRNVHELQQHVTVAHLDVKAFECETCGKRFGYRKDYQHHLLFHAELNVHCPETDCNYICKNTKTLNDHIRHKHRLLACEYCNETFTRQRLILHLRNVHRADINVELLGNSVATETSDESAAVASILNPTNSHQSSTTANGMDKVRVELVNATSVIPSLELPEQTSNAYQPMLVPDPQIEQYFLDSLIDPDNEIIVT